jgi:hypothetical protein
LLSRSTTAPWRHCAQSGTRIKRPHHNSRYGRRREIIAAHHFFSLLCAGAAARGSFGLSARHDIELFLMHRPMALFHEQNVGVDSAHLVHARVAAPYCTKHSRGIIAADRCGAAYAFLLPGQTRTMSGPSGLSGFGVACAPDRPDKGTLSPLSVSGPRGRCPSGARLIVMHFPKPRPRRGRAT